jgi:hypothetical protein
LLFVIADSSIWKIYEIYLSIGSLTDAMLFLICPQRRADLRRFYPSFSKNTLRTIQVDPSIVLTEDIEHPTDSPTPTVDVDANTSQQAIK